MGKSHGFWTSRKCCKDWLFFDLTWLQVPHVRESKKIIWESAELLPFFFFFWEKKLRPRKIKGPVVSFIRFLYLFSLKTSNVQLLSRGNRVEWKQAHSPEADLQGGDTWANYCNPHRKHSERDAGGRELEERSGSQPSPSHGGLLEGKELALGTCALWRCTRPPNGRNTAGI